MVKRKRMWALTALLVSLMLVAAACGDDDDNGGDTTGNGGNGGDGGEEVTGSLNISGSSTVEPISSLVAERFREQNPGVQVAVDGPGTSDGFELFCNGETDISDASRAISEEEIAACAENGIEPLELEVAFDALSVIGHPSNPLTCLTFGDLYALFGVESEGFTAWSAADDLATELGGNDGFPDIPLTIVAPGEESGTYGSFIEITQEDIAAEREQPDDALRADYQISADDNVIIENAAGTEGGLGFVGLSFAINAGDSVKSFEIDGGEGCVPPSAENVINGTYPISRSLYIYVNPNKISENPALAPFVDFYLSDEGIVAAEEVQYVPLPADRLEAVRAAWEAAM